VPARFEVLGPDEGDLPRLRGYIDEHDLSADLIYRGAIPPGQAQTELARAAVHVLPSVGEVFPMTVLEALAAGTPTVMTRECGIADEFAERRIAVVTDTDAEALADAVERLLTDPVLRAEQRTGAEQSLREWLSIEAVANRLEVLYRGGPAVPAPA
jgi:glycosyltransferase involved in cell wall biosynthesis